MYDLIWITNNYKQNAIHTYWFSDLINWWMEINNQLCLIVLWLLVDKFLQMQSVSVFVWWLSVSLMLYGSKHNRRLFARSVVWECMTMCSTLGTAHPHRQHRQLEEAVLLSPCKLLSNYWVRLSYSCQVTADDVQRCQRNHSTIVEGL